MQQQQRFKNSVPFHAGGAGRMTEASRTFSHYSQQSGKTNHSRRLSNTNHEV